jgi:hypothetical protein
MAKLSAPLDVPSGTEPKDRLGVPPEVSEAGDKEVP